MERKFGYYIVLGLVIGVVFGMGLGAANGSIIWGIGLGALFGVFIGWFVAVAAFESQKKKNDDNYSINSIETGHNTPISREYSKN
jgi:ABC-type uncharacterized transport system permease subunit